MNRSRQSFENPDGIGDMETAGIEPAVCFRRDSGVSDMSSLCSGHGFLRFVKCAGCGIRFPVRSPHAKRAKWCSERCRKRSYGDPCVDCGARTRFGAEQARVPEPRCFICAMALRRIWTEGVIIDRIREWEATYGEPPAMPDWYPGQARRQKDENRARRFELAEGFWPHAQIVVEVFGRWNTGIEAAGFAPRRADGGGDNVSRRRSARAKGAAA